MSIGRSTYELAFSKSPIFLNGGIAENLPGKTLPLIAITQSASIVGNLLTSLPNLNLDDFYATFYPLPGSELHNNQIGRYPFANQKVAANSIIAQPLKVSMRMNCSPRMAGAMVSRIMTSTALKNALDNHNFRGGTYSVLTPSFFYQGCILLRMADITSGESKHQQTDWQLDFEQPLLSGNEATLYQNALMKKLTGGLPSGVLWSGIPGI